jgi:threonyl-tRNA synthetase
MNAKIRERAIREVPFLLIVVEKEAEANIRTRGKEKMEDMGMVKFVEKIEGLIEENWPGL